MQINDDWKIESDALNVILYHKTDPNVVVHGIVKERADAKKRRLAENVGGDDDEVTESGWRKVGYYGTVAGALSTLLEREVLGTGLASLQVVNARIEAVSSDIYKTLGKLRQVP